MPSAAIATGHRVIATSQTYRIVAWVILGERLILNEFLTYIALSELVLTPSRIDGLLRVVISFARGLGLLLFGKGVPLWSRGIESR